MRYNMYVLLCLLLRLTPAHSESFDIVGTYTGFNEDTLTFAISDSSDFGKGASIHANDKYKINTVIFIPKEKDLLKMMDYIGQQILWLNPSANINGFTQTDVDAAFANGKQACVEDPASCGITIASLGGFTQTDIDAAFANGKQACVEDPASCGITIASLGGFTQTDIDAAFVNGKQAGIEDPASCGISLSEPITNSKPTPSLSPTFNLHLNELDFVTEQGNQTLWANLKLVPDSQRILFEVTDFGTATGNDQDNDNYTFEQGDCNDINPDINPGMAEIKNDGIDQDCKVELSD